MLLAHQMRTGVIGQAKNLAGPGESSPLSPNVRILFYILFSGGV